MQIQDPSPLPGNQTMLSFCLTIIILTFLCSVSSDGSAESHLVEQEDIIALTQVPFIEKPCLIPLCKFSSLSESWCPILSIIQNPTIQDVRHFKEGLNRLRKVFQSADRDLAAGNCSTSSPSLENISKLFLIRRTWYRGPGCT